MDVFSRKMLKIASYHFNMKTNNLNIAILIMTIIGFGIAIYTATQGKYGRFPGGSSVNC